MDVNGTRYHLLLGEPDWRGCKEELPDTAPGVHPQSDAEAADDDPFVDWDSSRIALTLWRRIFQFAPVPGDALDLSARRGAARDRYGNWYWIGDDEKSIRVGSSGSGRTSMFWPLQDPGSAGTTAPAGSFRPRAAAAPRVIKLGGVAVTEHHYLVVGTVDPPGLLVFDLHAGGPPEQILWPAGVDFTPFDMAPAPGGGLWILDRAHRTYWALDCHLKVIRHSPVEVVPEPDDFQDQDGTPRPAPRQRVPIEPAVALSAVDPIAIEALADGTVLILDAQPDANRRSSAVLRYRFDVEVGTPQFLDVMKDRIEPEQNDFELFAHDFALLPRRGEEARDRLYVASREGNQAFAFDLRWTGDTFTLEPSAEYLPMRFFGGKGIVAAQGRAYYDFEDTWIDLVHQPRSRYRGSAVVHTPIFDGRQPDCVWHRLMLDGFIPRAARVEVWSRASNDKVELTKNRLEWQPEPAFVLRRDGSELPFAPRLSPRAASDRDGTWELLFQRARGQYLQLRLRLEGDGTTTPELRALRVYYPRFSYLENYLPAVYREDSESASFLDRFLALFEGFFTSIEDRIAAAQVLFDVQSAPAETLEWLAGWFGVALDPAWDDMRRRLFIRHAMDFFRYRGTIRGLQMALELAIARCPDEKIFREWGPSRPASVRIIERFRTRATPGVVLGDPTDLEGIRAVVEAVRWKPEEGGDKLLAGYREALSKSGSTSVPAVFPVQRPSDGTAGVWSAFTRRVLGFVPSAGAAQKKLWEDFLRRSYGAIGPLNEAYHKAYTAFSSVPLPAELPPAGAPLSDWYRFERVLAVRNAAHGFLVVLPVPIAETGHAADYRERRRLAERIIALEKPAHTVFEVKFYWAMFRVGEARVALDTQIHQGSRAPELLSPMVLGENYLAESFLAPRPPQDAADRQILGRDELRG